MMNTNTKYYLLKIHTVPFLANNHQVYNTLYSSLIEKTNFIECRFRTIFVLLYDKMYVAKIGHEFNIVTNKNNIDTFNGTSISVPKIIFNTKFYNEVKYKCTIDIINTIEPLITNKAKALINKNEHLSGLTKHILKHSDIQNELFIDVNNYDKVTQYTSHVELFNQYSYNVIKNKAIHIKQFLNITKNERK